MTYWELARLSIEAMVADKHPESSENWSAIVPMSVADGWGLDLARWSTEAQIIIKNFEARIERKLSIPKSAVVTAGEKSLDEFQAYLTAKASVTETRLIYYQTKALLAEWGE
jgi:hypothetical protein